jgi:hypothetical protein
MAVRRASVAALGASPLMMIALRKSRWRFPGSQALGDFGLEGWLCEQKYSAIKLYIVSCSSLL